MPPAVGLRPSDRRSSDRGGQPDRRSGTVIVVALLNLAYFGIEFAVARTTGSVSLFADSIDFLERKGQRLVAIGWSARRRSIVGMILAALLFAPAVATAWTGWEKFNFRVPPAATPLSVKS